ncbi:MAG: methionyl-tRNA formyltransferase [Candidatus Moranbacteria bacterium]|nr:methionyl-tRNA formyltransferase [Candidatus Moranbacteria bacterium]
MDTQKTNSEAPKIRVVFMGTPAFAQSILASLIDRRYNIVAAYTRPDKAIGRKQEIQESPVKQLAGKHAIPVEQPERFDEETLRKLKEYKPDMIVVVAYGKILPLSVLKIPGFGCINIHPSLLPKFRGPSPIQNALISGEETTGTTIMLMDEGVDSGDIIAQKVVAIDADERYPELAETLANESAALLLETLPAWIERRITSQSQDASQATLCQLIEREDGHILWNTDAVTIYNAYRALYPWPGMYSIWHREDGQRLRIKLIRIACQKQSPQTTHRLGEVFELGEKIGVQTSSGVILLEEVHLEGKTVAPIKEFVKGYPQFIGSVLQ